MLAYRNNPNLEGDILTLLAEEIFESLPNSDAMGWPLRFANAIAPGADLSRVWPQFVRRVLYSIALPNAGAGAADSTAHSAAYAAAWSAMANKLIELLETA